MIKFFRKIRLKLVAEHKFSRYLIYAFGEIILVVIGILIALQINNANEESKKEEIKKTYYNQILKDLSKDYFYVTSEIKRLTSNIALYEEYTANFSKQPSIKELIFSQLKLNYVYMYQEFNTNTIETLQATGDIKLIPEKIRNKLIDLKNAQDNLIKTTYSNNDNFAKALIEASKLGFMPNVLRGLNNKNKLIDDLNVENNFSKIALIVNSAYNLKNFTEVDQLKLSQVMLNDISNIFEFINEELGKPYASIDKVLNNTIPLEKLLNEGKSIDEVIAIAKKQDKENPVYTISENYINSLGYFYLNNAQQTEDALKLFKLNIELYPNAWNTYDSYGEGLLRIGDTINSIKAYQKSLGLNPNNQTAKDVLSNLKK